MEDAVLNVQLQLIATQNNDDDFYSMTAPAVIAAILLSAQEDARLRRVHERNARRQYLCRPQLLPNPRANTPWLALYNSMDDRSFITTMGVDVATFHYLLDEGFEDLWNTIPIPRNDTSSAGDPRIGARSLDAAGGLGLYLHWITSTMRETSLQEIFALIPTTVNRYLEFAENILHAVLQVLPDARVGWPEDEPAFRAYRDAIQARHPLLEGAFGTMDGLELLTQVAYNDPMVENATYNGWLHSHCISCVMAFAPDGTIMAAELNAPGSWHDSRVACGIYEKLQTSTPDRYYLVCDTAFPRGMSQVSGRIKAPLKQGEQIPPGLAAEILAFNRALLSYRQSVEWGMRQLQGAFGRLRIPTNIHRTSRRVHLLEMIMRLNNMRARRVGISQIQSVYMPIWRDTDGNSLWDDLGEMLLSDIYEHDRVRRFHLTSL